MSAGVGPALAERGLLPLPILRRGIRTLLERRLSDERARARGIDAFVRELESSPVAVHTADANDQHYEVPAAFFERALGPRLKYSSALWPEGVTTLGDAEEAMLALTCDRAGLTDGQDVLELGCGWGSLTLWMAERYPNSRIVAVSNSASQRAFITARAPGNVRVITADMNDFTTAARFDRVVSVEMFEHMRNYGELLRRIRGWLRADGRLFVHVFCHLKYAYPFETDGPDDWMGRHFFTGGLMPSFDLIPGFDRDMVIEAGWRVGGEHYERTARAWRENLEARRTEILPVLAELYGADAPRWFHRWRLFFLACEELFGYRKGTEWMVGHYRFAPR